MSIRNAPPLLADVAASAPATNSSESPGRKVMKTSPVSEKKIANSTA